MSTYTTPTKEPLYFKNYYIEDRKRVFEKHVIDFISVMRQEINLIPPDLEMKISHLHNLVTEVYSMMNNVKEDKRDLEINYSEFVKEIKKIRTCKIFPLTAMIIFN